jgi:spore coat polysaccharide biosynthesis protein SpsF (cytidylyltransferase family)
MGSSRLPGKVMMDVAGRPLLAYLVDRLSRAASLDAILVATTTNERDNIIIEECERRRIANFRGSEFDVLARYVSAARACDAGIIVRITADNPFTDPGSIDRTVETVASDAAEYAVETNLPVGITGEALTWQALSFIDAVATKPAWREHVTLFAKDNPHTLRCAFLEPGDGYRRPDLSFTVDTPSEYRYVAALASELGSTDFELKNLIATADVANVRARSLAI